MEVDLPLGADGWVYFWELVGVLRKLVGVALPLVAGGSVCLREFVGWGLLCFGSWGVGVCLLELMGMVCLWQLMREGLPLGVDGWVCLWELVGGNGGCLRELVGVVLNTCDNFSAENLYNGFKKCDFLSEKYVN